jgi:hypothetical protein
VGICRAYLRLAGAPGSSCPGRAARAVHARSRAGGPAAHRHDVIPHRVFRASAPGAVRVRAESGPSLGWTEWQPWLPDDDGLRWQPWLPDDDGLRWQPWLPDDDGLRWQPWLPDDDGLRWQPWLPDDGLRWQPWLPGDDGLRWQPWLPGDDGLSGSHGCQVIMD